MRVQESPAEAWLNSGRPWGRGTEYNSPGISPFEGLPLRLPEAKYRQETQPHPPLENWIKDLLSMALPIRTRPIFPHRKSLLTGSFHKPLILIPQSADRMETTVTELTKLITWITALSNSMKL